MNERIFTELYKKTWGHFPCPTGEPELEKFAELIVRDAMDYASRNWEHGHLLAQDLKVHFGVE